ncbi:hypothetical protein A2U01_0072272, partial [Trifolium medium]|nr:hypothetical protein [Trifolium medium]
MAARRAGRRTGHAGRRTGHAGRSHQLDNHQPHTHIAPSAVKSCTPRQ